ncbi:hypothetical protein F2Q68_00003099 [Brassica cretica]|uniref:Uncharacterized protein n=1 Tax=Brassica cretica TaxID=69181 RepID=A0A8S9JKD4_BRACR|nr:hypothetical protein F2Q68_00003099 [Brassica cretica]
MTFPPTYAQWTITVRNEKGQKILIEHKLLHKEQQFHEVSKPIELLKKLVMLLEMEKEVAMEEKTNLGYKVTSLLEENRELATEALLMKK